MDTRLLIDFGSTFTKVVAIDLAKEEIIGRVQTPSTVDTDVTIGLRKAIDEMRAATGINDLAEQEALACSSAAGGLRMVSIGLVPSLTVEAATRAALGAGAKIVGCYSYKLTHRELSQIKGLLPDIILLAGGTDGGDEQTIVHNARLLAGSKLAAPVVVAGNKVVQEEVISVLETSGKYVRGADNVMPEVGILNVEPCRELIREIFMANITKAKGIDKAKQIIKNVVMPTPVAVLKAARLLAEGCAGENGLGELMVVDIGGATTNVHSVARGEPTRGGVVVKGLPEPVVKRTVEGDLGVRYNATRLLELAGKEKLKSRLPTPVDETEMVNIVHAFHMAIGRLPKTEAEISVETALCRVALEMAMERHVGHLETMPLPGGEVMIQRGKDLTQVNTVIGTGGPIIFGHKRNLVLSGVNFTEAAPFILKPKRPAFYVDERYIMYAAGLLAEEAPATALRVMKKYLKKLGNSG